MTEEERKLWFLFLRNMPIRVLRQKVIGEYIVDFYCARAKLVIEVDGSQHYWDVGHVSDQIRDKKLRALGLEILRIPNNQIHQDFQAVCAYIDKVINERL